MNFSMQCHQLEKLMLEEHVVVRHQANKSDGGAFWQGLPDAKELDPRTRYIAMNLAVTADEKCCYRYISIAGQALPAPPAAAPPPPPPPPALQLRVPPARASPLLPWLASARG